MFAILDVDGLANTDLALLRLFLAYDSVLWGNADQRGDLGTGHLFPDAVAPIKFPAIHKDVQVLVLVMFMVLTMFVSLMLFMMLCHFATSSLFLRFPAPSTSC